jgi:3-isopropylmalate/(R)-2-methylmalate dehydratase small subunit
MKYSGKAFKYGDNIDTDVIIPARYLSTAEPEELALHCLEDLDAEFIHKISPGDILVAGSNFGCGSSREHAPIAIKAAGIAVIIAAGFARIFYRNALNIGLPIAECPAAAAEIAEGDRVTVDFLAGEINNESRGRKYTLSPLPDFMMEIIAAGSLLNYTKKQLRAYRSAD